MNYFNEIKTSTNIIKPKIGLICNIGNAHSGKLGGINGVIEAKSELFENLNHNGTAIINIDDDNCVSIGKKFSGKKLTFGFSSKADVKISEVKTETINTISFNKQSNLSSSAILNYKNNKIKIKLKLPGKHNILNAAAAAAVTLAYGIDLETSVIGMEQMTSINGRFNIHRLKNGVLIINDFYNASPESTKIALNMLKYFKNCRKLVALGDMLELNEPIMHHKNIGYLCAKQDLNLIFTCGKYSNITINEAIKYGFNLKNTIITENAMQLAKKIAKIIKKK